MKRNFVLVGILALLLVGCSSTGETSQIGSTDNLKSKAPETSIIEPIVEETPVMDMDGCYTVDETYTYILCSEKDFEHPLIGFNAPVEWERTGYATFSIGGATRILNVNFNTDMRNSRGQIITINFTAVFTDSSGNSWPTPMDENFGSGGGKLQIDGEYVVDTPIGEITIYQATECANIDGEVHIIGYEEFALLSNGENEGYILLSSDKFGTYMKDALSRIF